MTDGEGNPYPVMRTTDLRDSAWAPVAGVGGREGPRRR